MKSGQKLWTREELILAINLYYRLPFGKLHRSNQEIIKLASLINRTPNSVAFKLVNFASLDPKLKERGIEGASNSSKLDKQIWDEFSENRYTLISLSEEIRAKKENTTIEEKYKNILLDVKDLRGEVMERIVKTRVNQSFFRQMVLANYSNKCAVTGIDIPELLFASHILPWSQNEKERLNPENGICLSALYDKAFDKGLIGINNDYKIILSSKLKDYASKEYYNQHFKNIEGQALISPLKYIPKQEFLEFHLDTIFDKV